MSLDQMKEFLTSIQNECAQTRILNAILVCYQDQKKLEEAIIAIQNKINEIINVINMRDAEALNPEIKEDNPQEDLTSTYTVPANQVSAEEVE